MSSNYLINKTVAFSSCVFFLEMMLMTRGIGEDDDADADDEGHCGGR